MTKNMPWMLPGCVLVSLFSFDAQALPLPLAFEPSADNITLVVPHVVVAPHYVPPVVVPHVVVAPHYVPPVVVPHVVVAPHYVPPAVVAPSVCPHGYYHDQEGHCVPY